MTKPTHASAGVCHPTLDIETVVDALNKSGALSDQSLSRVSEIAARFRAFSTRAYSLKSLGEVSPSVAEAFIRAPSSSGDPSVATMHLRRSVIRLLFRTARELGLADHDPTIDVVLPPRSSLRARPLTNEEMALCRTASLHSLLATRLPAAWALAEASARSSELGHVRVGDIDLARRRVNLHGGSKVNQRWAPLGDWGLTQLQRRLAGLSDDPDRPVVYDGTRGSDYHRQAASCTAISEVLRRAGLAAEPDVRPVSVAAWVGRQVLAESGRIEEVARRLGMRSLDRTAALIGWDWTLDAAADV